MNRESLTFFLGGHDLEMHTIASLLEAHGAQGFRAVPGRYTLEKILQKKKMFFFDYNTGWGAKASHYQYEIETCLKMGRIPCLIEVENDAAFPSPPCLEIDHHGSQAGISQPTALHQVFFDVLKLPEADWSRQYELIAANDRGYIPEMLKAGATQDEIMTIRQADRLAQGVTRAEEKQAARAAGQLEILAAGNLTLARLPHNRTSALCDRLDPASGGPGYKNLLIFCPEEINFFGRGLLIKELVQKFPGGWYGGALERASNREITGGQGFWGIKTHEKSDQDKVLLFLLAILNTFLEQSPACNVLI